MSPRLPTGPGRVLRVAGRVLDRAAGRADVPAAAPLPVRVREPAPQQPTRPGWVRVTSKVLGVFVLAGATLFVAPGTASALPIIGGCTTPPVPESPQQGIAGFFMSKPDPVPPAEDPFASGAKTTPFEQYGLAGLSWYTYDLGCGGAARDPSGSISTWAAQLMFIPAKATVAALTGVMQAALQPTYLAAFDPLLNNLVSQLRRASTRRCSRSR